MAMKEAKHDVQKTPPKKKEGRRNNEKK